MDSKKIGRLLMWLAICFVLAITVEWIILFLGYFFAMGFYIIYYGVKGLNFSLMNEGHFLTGFSRYYAIAFSIYMINALPVILFGVFFKKLYAIIFGTAAISMLLSLPNLHKLVPPQLLFSKYSSWVLAIIILLAFIQIAIFCSMLHIAYLRKVKHEIAAMLVSWLLSIPIGLGISWFIWPLIKIS